MKVTKTKQIVFRENGEKVTQTNLFFLPAFCDVLLCEGHQKQNKTNLFVDARFFLAAGVFRVHEQVRIHGGSKWDTHGQKWESVSITAVEAVEA